MDYDKQAQINTRRLWAVSAVTRAQELIAVASRHLQDATPDRNANDGTRLLFDGYQRLIDNVRELRSRAEAQIIAANEGNVPDAAELADIRSGLAAAAAALGVA